MCTDPRRNAVVNIVSSEIGAVLKPDGWNHPVSLIWGYGGICLATSAGLVGLRR